MKGVTTPRKGLQDLAAPGPGYILVVDDDEDMRELLRLHLQNAGYRVITAEDAVIAGHYVVERAPELIIADYKMPYMSGLEFVGALRAVARQLSSGHPPGPGSGPGFPPPSRR